MVIFYPLMSSAIAAGLYHPRCRDSHTTYFPGITTADGSWSKKEIEQLEKKEKKRAKEQYAERQAEKYGRLAEYSLDEENQRNYGTKADIWRSVSLDYMGKPVNADLNGEKLKAYKADGTSNIYSQTYSADAKKTINFIEKMKSEFPELEAAERIYLYSKGEIGIGAYQQSSNSFFFDERLANDDYIREFLKSGYFQAQNKKEIILHEVAHFKHWAAAERFYLENPEKYATLKEAKTAMEAELREYVSRQTLSDFLYVRKIISLNASDAFERGNINELVADALIAIKRESLKDPFLGSLVKGIVL